MTRPFVLAALVVAATSAAQESAPARPQVPALAEAAAALVAELRLSGAGLTVLRGEAVAHESTHGEFTGAQVLPIASASKWLAVATVLTLVDDGTLALEQPVAKWLPEFDRDDKRGITLRQCLSCTSGLADRAAITRPRDGDMAAVAATLATLPLSAPAGTAFRYGGGGFQIAACVAERVSGKSWHELFAARIAGPLGMHATRFGRLVPVGSEAGTTKVPWVAGGAVSTLHDYTRFVAMLLAGGKAGTRTVLSAQSVDAMLSVQTGDLTVRLAGVLEEPDVHYGLGTWLTREAGAPQRASDPGAFGFTPWLDRDLGIGGVFAVRDRVARLLPRLRPLQDLARTALDTHSAPARDETVTLSHGGRERRYLLHVPPRGDATTPLPLLLVLHGGGGNGKQVAATTGFSALADRKGFVVAYPDGTGPLGGRLLTWNSGGLDVYAQQQQVDDVGFLKAAVADIATRTPIDRARVSVAGHSNGAMLAHRLAREAADVFAAVACIAGAMNFQAADTRLPISVLLIHGTADQHVPLQGGRPQQSVFGVGNRDDASLADAIAYYRERNGLGGDATSTQDGKVQIRTWGPAASGARLRVITLEGGGHAWPGGKAPSRRSDAPFPFDASAAVWEFCQEARR